MRRRKAWIVGTGIVCVLLVGSAIVQRRARRSHPFDFIARMPVKFISGTRPIPHPAVGLYHESGNLVYEIQVPFDEFKRLLRAHREEKSTNERSWNTPGSEITLESREGGWNVLHLSHRAPGFVWKPNPGALGFVWIQEPMNVYPVGFWGGVAWTLMDKP